MAIFGPGALDHGDSSGDRIIYLGVVCGVVLAAISITILILDPDMFVLAGAMLLWLIVIVWLIYIAPYLFFLLWILVPIVGSANYVWTGYFRRNPKTWGSESCFFMPCSPQSIKDEDQIYALLASLFLFIGLEGLPPALKYL